jgi:hypothetical protein
MKQRALPPIHSTRDGEPDLEPEIDAFVFGLGELVDSFQDAETAGALTSIEQMAERLRERATHLGYRPVADSARRILAACGERSPDALRKSIVDLTDVAQRVRRGHRSAAL